MKQMCFLLILSLFINCTSSVENSTSVTSCEKYCDTIFAGDYYNGVNQRKYVIKVDNGKDGNVLFHLNKGSLIRISISEFNEYPIYCANIKGADVLKVDSTDTFFRIIPKEKKFSFTLYQDYGKDNVIIYIRNWIDKQKGKYEETASPQIGIKEVGTIDLTVD